MIRLHTGKSNRKIGSFFPTSLLLSMAYSSFGVFEQIVEVIALGPAFTDRAIYRLVVTQRNNCSSNNSDNRNIL